MAFLYIAAGVYHFVNPAMYMKIMPSWVPLHKEMVIISGVLEILFGLMLLFPLTRVAGAWGIVFLLIAVFPANIQMAVDYYNKQSPQLWVAIARLPLQVLLIWWAWIYTKK